MINFVTTFIAGTLVILLSMALVGGLVFGLMALAVWVLTSMGVNEPTAYIVGYVAVIPALGGLLIAIVEAG